MQDSLGDRMKGNYEDRQRLYLTRRTPVIIRVDGRAFHTFTSKLRKPFDTRLINSMVLSAVDVVKEIQGCKLAYVQSDEVSFVLTDYDKLDTQAWFDYNKSKIETIAAALMTAYFGRYMREHEIYDLAIFDARSFNIPESEIANYLLWRSKDWHRNSVQMLAQSMYSHKQLQGMSIPEQLEMVQKVGEDWNNLTDREKYGTFITRDGLHGGVQPDYRTIQDLWIHK